MSYKELIGYIKPGHYKFRSENGFTITTFYLETGGQIPIKGIFKDLPEGFIKVIGKIESHPIYGDSFKMESYQYYLPQTREGIVVYLKKQMKITKIQAEKIVDYLKTDIFNKLDENINIIDEIPKLFKKEDKKEAFKNLRIEIQKTREIRFFLYTYELSESQINEILKIYKNNTIEKIKENPYSLLKINGIGFKTADKVALDSGYTLRDERRILAGIYYAIEEDCARSGSLYITFFKLIPIVNKFLQLNTPQLQLQAEEINKLLNKLSIKNKDNLGFRDPSLDMEIYKPLKRVNFNGENLIFIFDYYNWENYLGEYISKAISLDKYPTKKFNINPETNEIKLNEKQKEAIKMVFENRLSILRGYGGTGKSTVIKQIIKHAKENNLSYLLLAPTGKAVDVLINITKDSRNCSTIHRAIGLRQEGTIGTETLKQDLIIIDESSMISIPLAYSLLKALELRLFFSTTKILFVGDDNQLKPVGLGQFFLTLINSKLIPETKLTEVYRQKEDSLILENSKRLIEKTPMLLEKETSDWTFINIQNYDDKSIKLILFETIKVNGWNMETDVILNASYKGELGIHKLNEELQEKLKNSKHKYQIGFHKYYLGERVMHINENWYREKETHLEALPLEIITNKNNIKELRKIYQSYNLPVEEFPYCQKLYYNKRINTIEYNGVIIGKIKEGKLEVKQKDLKKNIFELANNYFDHNVYNGNWGRIIALKNENQEWVGLVDGEEKILDINSLYKPGKNTKIEDQDKAFSTQYKTQHFLNQINKENKKNKKNKADEYVMLVEFSDKIIFYTKDSLKNLTLFYATSVHKAQGSQFSTAYSLCLPQNKYMLNKNWLYTALTRAQNKLYYYSTPRLTREIQFKENQDERKSIFLNLLKGYYELLKKTPKKNKIFNEK